MTMPTRSLNLIGATNFRDLGGYVGHGGRTVVWRRIFRSDHLAELTAADAATVAALGLARVCDFRGVAERAPLACKLPAWLCTLCRWSLPCSRRFKPGWKRGNR
jgi:protein-tyrosine phosphatase